MLHGWFDRSWSWIHQCVHDLGFGSLYFMGIPPFSHNYLGPRWWQLKYVLCSPPNIGEDFPNLTTVYNIFSDGWRTNHHLVTIYKKEFHVADCPLGSVWMKGRFSKKIKRSLQRARETSPDGVSAHLSRTARAVFESISIMRISQITRPLGVNMGLRFCFLFGGEQTWCSRMS